MLFVSLVFIPVVEELAIIGGETVGSITVILLPVVLVFPLLLLVVRKRSGEGDFREDETDIPFKIGPLIDCKPLPFPEEDKEEAKEDAPTIPVGGDVRTDVGEVNGKGD